MKKAGKSQWGGKRPNSGRKPLGDSPRITCSIVFDQAILKRVENYAKRKEVSRSIAVETLCDKSLTIEEGGQKATR